MSEPRIGKMIKLRVFEALVETLRKELNQAVEASKEAADYATNEEAKAESKWDTQGLEASYLAAGQANQARQFAEALAILEQNRESLTASKNIAERGALVTCDFAGEEEVFYIVPVAGGEVLEIDGRVVTVVTHQSPVVAQLLGKSAGNSFLTGNQAAGTIVEIR